MIPVSPVMPGSQGIEMMLGKDQPQCEPLPAVYLSTPRLPVLTRWRFSEEERAQIAAGADIVLTQLTFNNGFQPIHLQVSMPEEMPILLD